MCLKNFKLWGVCFPILLLSCSSEDNTKGSLDQETSAVEQLTSEYGQDVEPQMFERVISLSKELVLRQRAEGIATFIQALQEELKNRNLVDSSLQEIQDWNLGEPLPGVGNFEEGVEASEISSVKQGLTQPDKYRECPPLAPEEGQGVSCKEIIETVTTRIKAQVSTQTSEAVYHAAEQLIMGDEILSTKSKEFQIYAKQYLGYLANEVMQYGIMVASIRAEYTLRNSGTCDVGDLDPLEIARLRGTEEAVKILKQMIQKSGLTLAPQGESCLELGPTGAVTQAKINSAVEAFLKKEKLCQSGDLSYSNPAVVEAEKVRKEAIFAGIKAHTTVIWIGIMRNGIWWGNKSSKVVAVVDGCTPKDQITYTTSPLVIDLDGDGLELSTQRVNFDLLATGQPQRVTWPGAHEGLLFIDLDQDGQVTSGRELFGNRTDCKGMRCQDGAEALAQYDLKKWGGNADGRIDAKDEGFHRLKVWVDQNHDGHSQPEEVAPLSTYGIQAFSLEATRFLEKVPAGKITLSFSAYLNNGVRTVYDVWFHNTVLPGLPMLAN